MEHESTFTPLIYKIEIIVEFTIFVDASKSA